MPKVSPELRDRLGYLEPEGKVPRGHIWTPEEGLRPQTTADLRHYDSGAVRSNDVKRRFDLICPTALEHLADVMQEGLLKYGPDNWTKGMDIGETLNRAQAHLNQYLKGDTSEPHLSHALWNVMAVIHFAYGCSCHVRRKDLERMTKLYASQQAGESTSGQR